MIIRKISIALLLCISPIFAQANNIQIGKGVPAVSVEKGGEVFIENDTISYLPWNTELMLGKVRVIQAIAGRSGAKALNAPLMAAITKAEFSEENYQTTTIVNQDDAIWGTGSFVKSSAEDGKKDFPWSSMVLDENGVAAKQWQLEPKSSTIIVQDKTGRVLFNKTGELSIGEITQVLKIIKKNL
ncbi:Protein ytfJ precursor [Vibrio casei]|uniref:YtfJ family protein n=1 Tax=Vibrio casei TaxID=673372 RepID=A0A368LKW9_9VIBR|nr:MULTISPECIES: YtfJ family protein [Vibrio]RCS72436.1 YtfJ family protein [Vibrio casei]SJN36778.1 Protein ytfJ precursor [Vibrio casei]HBV76606.1 YtfJ family protein [Vibrio sp.]